MTFKLDIDSIAHAQIQDLPVPVLALLAEALTVLALVPQTTGEPYHRDNPDGLRRLLFGPHREGQILYLPLPDQDRVDVLRVDWLTLD
jgi:hypothetical protein